MRNPPPHLIVVRPLCLTEMWGLFCKSYFCLPDEAFDYLLSVRQLSGLSPASSDGEGISTHTNLRASCGTADGIPPLCRKLSREQFV